MAQTQTLPPAQPAYILRGHSSQIHSALFIRSNSRLVTGDADGWIVVWSLATKRPIAVWRAHEGSILGIGAWGDGRLITHGKDNKLIVWRFSAEDENSMSKVLPVDAVQEPRKQPWLLHVLQVNTMNFCSFAQADIPSLDTAFDELLIAVPNTMSSETVDIFHLPSNKRIHTIPNDPSFKGGMIMALSIFYHTTANTLTVLAGTESGHTFTSILMAENNNTHAWKTTYISNPHSQPILSLSPSPEKTFYLTSSADAIIAKHPINSAGATKTAQTRHAGQQCLKIRNDGLVFATAGWDARVRVYSCRSMKEVAVLKWHKEGCYAVAFADVCVSEDSNSNVHKKDTQSKSENNGKDMVLGSVKEQRLAKAKAAHWLAVGSKDGKISLWDIF